MALKCFVLENDPNQEVRHAAVAKAVKNHLGESAEVEYSEKGKPSIVGTEDPHYISVTTTGEKMILAINDTPIGIDAEYLPRYEERKIDYIALAERFFSGDEAEYIRGEGEDKEKEKFIAVWTRKEAYVKCVGKTVSDFPSFSVVDGDRILTKLNGVSIRKFSIRFEGCENYVLAISGV